MKSYLAPTLLLIVIIFPGISSQVNMQIKLDPNRPTSLYEGPPTNRRDERGRPFKSIIVTSKPFGFATGTTFDRNPLSDSSSSSTTTTTERNVRSQPLNNGRPLKTFVVTSRPFGIADSESNSIGDATTTTTTQNPLLVKVLPTIPFFSISCTVGSSCSQIISARQQMTAKPTFKPYTKEEMEKFKGTLNSKLASNVYANLFKSNSSTTTTEKPSTSLHLWRIRTTPSTTTHSSPSTTTTTTTAQPTRNNKPSSNWSSIWKWPGQATPTNKEEVKDVVIQANNQRVESVTSGSIKTPSFGFQRNPLPTLRTKFNPFKASTPRPEEKINALSANGGNWLSLLTASLSALQNHQGNSQKHALSHQPQTKATVSTPKPPLFISRPTKSRPLPTSATTPVSHQQNWDSPTWSNEANVLNWGPEENMGKNQPENIQNYFQHEVISSKGNKISLITGSGNRHKTVNKPVQPTRYNNVVLPPEVSVSSHVIGLSVKPKSLESGPAFIENVQGVAIETDGENLNLSDLIMKEDLPRRPARYLPLTQRYPSTRGDQPIRNPRQFYVYRPGPSFIPASDRRLVRFPVA